MKKVYEDAFILHDESADDHKESEKFSEDKNKHDDNRPDSAAVKSVSLWTFGSFVSFETA